MATTTNKPAANRPTSARDFASEIRRGLEILCDKFNAGDWRGVARVAYTIERTAKLAEKLTDDEWPDEVVGLGPAADVLTTENTEGTER